MWSEVANAIRVLRGGSWRRIEQESKLELLPSVSMLLTILNAVVPRMWEEIAVCLGLQTAKRSHFDAKVSLCFCLLGHTPYFEFRDITISTLWHNWHLVPLERSKTKLLFECLYDFVPALGDKQNEGWSVTTKSWNFHRSSWSVINWK